MTSPIETNNVVERTLCGVEQPKRIWLMVYRHAGDVCWTSDPNPDDADEIETVEYVRADLAQSLSDRIDVLEGAGNTLAETVKLIKHVLVANLTKRELSILMDDLHAWNAASLARDSK